MPDGTFPRGSSYVRGLAPGYNARWYISRTITCSPYSWQSVPRRTQADEHRICLLRIQRSRIFLSSTVKYISPTDVWYADRRTDQHLTATFLSRERLSVSGRPRDPPPGVVLPAEHPRFISSDALITSASVARLRCHCARDIQARAHPFRTHRPSTSSRPTSRPHCITPNYRIPHCSLSFSC